MRNTIIFLLLLTFISCGSEKKSENNTKDLYAIVSTMYNHVTMETMISYTFQAPPPVKGMNLDSLIASRKDKDTLKLMKELVRKRGKLIIAIDSLMSPPQLSNNTKSYVKECLDSGFEDAFKLFKSERDTISLDITRLSATDFSIATPFGDKDKNSLNQDFEKFNVYLKFSNISFNKDRTKAYVVIGVRFGRRNGFSSIYFLRKEKSKWIIKCKRGLSIS